MNLVTDRSITLSFALILPDEAFLYYSQGMYDTYVNAVLSEQALNGNSLMTAYSDLNEKLDKIGIEYESYLQNMGRQLFYTVASIYITLYLAIVFLVVANTIVGVQFLMSQQKTGRRYQTLIRLGALTKAFASLPESRLRGLWDFLYWLQLSAVCLESERCLQGYSRPEPVGQCLKCCLYLLL